MAIVTAVLLAMSLPVGALSSPETAAARPASACYPNNKETTRPTIHDACINGANVDTRGFLGNGAGCFDFRAPGFIYEKWNQCGGGGIEYIAQARVITYLNKHPVESHRYPDDFELLPAITGSVQWEVRVPGGRADVVNYNRYVYGDPIFEVYELKLTTNRKFGKRKEQLKRYVDEFKAMGMVNAEAGTTLQYYEDYFYVRDPKLKCEETTGHPSDDKGLLRSFKSAYTDEGIIDVSEEKPVCVDTNNRLPDKLKKWEELEDGQAPPPTTWERYKRAWGLGSGDPHLTTTDGLTYDFQAAGEFQLASSETYDFEVQARLIPERSWSVFDRAAVRVHETVLELGRDGSLLIDGDPVSLPRGGTLSLGEDSYIARSLPPMPDKYAIALDSTEDSPLFHWTPGAAGTAALNMPVEGNSDLKGLLGNNDGNPLNDLKLSDGTQLPANVAASTLYGTFANSWRVKNETSLFSYAPGQTTSNFTDLNFPPNVVTINQLTSEQYSLASQVCAANSVAAGPQFDDCVLDVALTQNNEFAAIAAQRKEIAVDPHAATVSAAGDLTADFEAAVLPSNVSSGRVTADAAVSAFAGPFSGSGSYRMYVQQLPAHLAGTLSFDLLALGDWDSDPDAEQVTIQVNRQPVWTGSVAGLTPTSSGVLASGQPYRVYRMSVPVPARESQVEAVVSASGVDGVHDQGFGIDNLTVHVDVVPPQIFDTSLPLNLSSGNLGNGAGVLETAASADVYRFNATEDQSVFVQPVSCLSDKLAWSLVNETTGAQAATGTCQGRLVEHLPAGMYRLVVTGQDGQTGAYNLTAFVVPPPVSATATVDGAPVTVTTTVGPQRARVQFQGTAGQRVDVRLSNGSTGHTFLGIHGPDGSTLNDRTDILYSSSALRGALTLPATGTYTVDLDSWDEIAGSWTVAVNSIPPDVQASLVVDGAAATVTTTAGTQRAHIAFDGTAGQRVDLNFSNGSMGYTFLGLTGPDGNGLLPTMDTLREASGKRALITLPATGRYTIDLDSWDEVAGSWTVAVTSVPPDVSATMMMDGPPVRVATTAASQHMKVQFAGTAGSKVLLNFTNGTMGRTWVAVTAPNGNGLTESYDALRESTGRRGPLTLPATGVYTVDLSSWDGLVGGWSVQAINVPPDVTATTAVDGAPVTVTTTVGIQQSHVSFTGTAGQKVRLNFSNGSMGSTYATLRAPNGAQLNPSGDVLANPAEVRGPFILPATGTYTVDLDSWPDLAGSWTLGVATVPADPTATLTVDGAAVSVTTTDGLQKAHVSFAGTAGQQLVLRFTGNTMGATAVVVGTPTGTNLNTGDIGTATTWGPYTLTTTGTYTIDLDSRGDLAGAVTVQALSLGYSTPTTTDPSAQYEFVGVQSGKCLTARGGDGTQLVQQTCGVTGARFTVESLGNSVVRLHPTNAATSCLDLRGGSAANGTAIQQYTCQPATSGNYPNQLFHIDTRSSSTAVGDPVVTISPNSTGKIFDIVSASTADNANVQQWDYAGTTNQQFTLHKVSDTTPALVLDPAAKYECPAPGLMETSNTRRIHRYAGTEEVRR